MERSNRRLEDENRQKSDFLATMSHELRTPLSSIIAFTDIWEKSHAGDDSAERRLVEEIKQNSTTLLNMVNNTIDAAKLEAGSLRVQCSDVDLVDVVEVVFSVGMCVLLFMILIWLSHSEHLDLVRAMRQAEEKRRAEIAAREAEERVKRIAEAAQRQAEQAQRAQEEARIALARAKEATREAMELEAEKRELEAAARQAEAQMLAVEEAHRIEELRAAQLLEQKHQREEEGAPADKPRRQEG